MRSRKNSEEDRRNIVSHRLRQARLAFDPPLTQDQLAGRLAKHGLFLDRVAIAKIETGQRCVFDYEVRDLSLVLKVEASWLLGIEQGRSVNQKKSARKGD